VASRLKKGRFQVSAKDETRCTDCGLCRSVVICPSPRVCIGCGACVAGCPNEARRLVPDETKRRQIRINVDGRTFPTPEGVTLKQALEEGGWTFGIAPGEGDLAAPCRTGGCFSCAVLADGQVVRACVHPVAEGMAVETALPPNRQPLRIIHGPQPHSVGGKATPWDLKARGRYVEVAIWSAGCNLRCPQCQNFTTTYNGRSAPLTPQEAAYRVTRARRRYGVDRMAISGGEPTLNRTWLVTYFRTLRTRNPDPAARLHLDSNGTLLTTDYVDELVEAGVTDIGVEPKGVTPETFMHISGISDRALVERYLQTAWEAIAYIADRFRNHVFLGVGLPYNAALISMEEVDTFGRRLASIDPDIQLCVLDYFPTFRRRDLVRPHPREMDQVRRTLEDTGLSAVVVQTSRGHLGPKQRRDE
jgi:pyruvate formate lyase activating enzyme